VATLPIPFPARTGRPRKKVDREKILALRAKGVSWRQIAKRMHLGLGTVCRAAHNRTKSVP
jgi:DNA invertase Pin-like site-specific DNA recombinase